MAMNENEGGSAYPPNPDVKSGSCLIAGFQPLTVVHPSYWNAYKAESGATFSIDMVRLKLSFINGKGEVRAAITRIAGKFKNWLPLEKPIDILRRLADNPLIARREVLAAIERDKAGKAVRAANKSVGDAMKSASSEIDALANEARAMMDARSELEDKAGEPDHTAAKSFHGRD